jgi:hypothetical protein
LGGLIEDSVVPLLLVGTKRHFFNTSWGPRAA